MQPGFRGSSKNALFDPDPRAKFAMLLAVNIIMISGSSAGVELILRAICAALPFVLLLSIKHFRTAVVYFFLLAVAVYCEGFVLPQTHGIGSILLMIPCGILTRFMTGYMMCWYTVRSTSVSEFVTAMEKMHTPYFITIPMSVMFRYFPTLGEEYRSIHDAMKMREIGQTIKNPLTYTEYILVPIMMSTVRIADELSAASLTKGLSAGGRRTHICEVKLNVVDWLIIAGSAVMVTLFFIY
ncbi:MAG: energy-coupling factor transporter transmembrane protein EcfT [Ruminococcus sp.]|nr:energy-coupling factor transporter transmembrane protein EcfT [Ruminococcus sp.]